MRKETSKTLKSLTQGEALRKKLVPTARLSVRSVGGGDRYLGGGFGAATFGVPLSPGGETRLAAQGRASSSMIG